MLKYFVRVTWNTLSNREVIAFTTGWDAKASITNAFSAVVGLEGAHSCGRVARHTRAEVAALGVGAVAPLPADIGHILALVIIWIHKNKEQGK